MNVMDYDYHGGWENFTGHNTPLFGRHEEDVVGHPGHNFNVNDTISWWLDNVRRRMSWTADDVDS